MDCCVKEGAKVIFEWPTNNLYWKDRRVVKYFEQPIWKRHDIHGCAYGLTSLVSEGRPIKKPWTLMTTFSGKASCMMKHCSCYTPDGDRPPRLRRGEKHQPCAGRDTKQTESYPKQLADEFHSMFSDYAKALDAERQDSC